MLFAFLAEMETFCHVFSSFPVVSSLNTIFRAYISTAQKVFSNPQICSNFMCNFFFFFSAFSAIPLLTINFHFAPTVSNSRHLPAFSPFPTMFSKGYILRVVKSRDCVVKSFKQSVLFMDNDFLG